ncbi:beta-xylosidase [Kineosporia succinea]|uniref:Beta-xylosidase n=1 Tax=Kineosporia succinea TaxID=84632 RepID=A0ABT9P5Y8_9ACTN|nr:family 43 glycosylhydrolase [Kineosporia succinea]MDP9828099.1 beta-xylosidase [Kineosporia succinea]
MSSVFSLRPGKRRWRLTGLLAAALVTAAVVPTALHLRPAGAAEYPGPGVVSGNTAVHDPSMVKGPDGTYLLAATAPGLALRTSTDRTRWTYTGLAFPNGSATWTDEYTGTSNGNLWAPDLSYRNGTFYLYYAASSFGKNKSAIFLATSTTGKPGSWTNQGKVYSHHDQRRPQRHRPQPGRRPQWQVVALARLVLDRHQDDRAQSLDR